MQREGGLTITYTYVYDSRSKSTSTCSSLYFRRYLVSALWLWFTTWRRDLHMGTSGFPGHKRGRETRNFNVSGCHFLPRPYPPPVLPLIIFSPKAVLLHLVASLLRARKSRQLPRAPPLRQPAHPSICEHLPAFELQSPHNGVLKSSLKDSQMPSLPLPMRISSHILPPFINSIGITSVSTHPKYDRH